MTDKSFVSLYLGLGSGLWTDSVKCGLMPAVQVYKYTVFSAAAEYRPQSILLLTGGGELVICKLYMYLQSSLQ